MNKETQAAYNKVVELISVAAIKLKRGNYEEFAINEHKNQR